MGEQKVQNDYSLWLMIIENSHSKMAEYKETEGFGMIFARNVVKKISKFVYIKKKNVFLQRKNLFNLCQENNLIEYPT